MKFLGNNLWLILGPPSTPVSSQRLSAQKKIFFTFL